MKKRVLFTAFISALFILTGCNEKITSGEQKVERPEVRGVSIEEMRLIEVDDYYEVSGSVRSKNTSLVAAKVMGEVKEIRVKNADRVRKGDVLLIIHAPDIKAKVDAADEAVAEAAKGLHVADENRRLAAQTYKRFNRLYEEKAVSGQEFDEISSKKDVANLQYELAQKTLRKAEAARSEAEAYKGYTVISAPVSGIIAEKNIDTGSMTIPGATLFIIEAPEYRVEAPVDEGLISAINIGSQADIVIDALNINTTGTVSEIVRQVDPLTRTYNVKVDLKDERSLQGGLYARVKFPVAKKAKLFVPERVVVSRGELKGVYAVDKEGIVTFRLVKTGKGRDDMLEILSGLNAGERIIVSGIDKAVDGGKVVD